MIVYVPQPKPLAISQCFPTTSPPPDHPTYPLRPSLSVTAHPYYPNTPLLISPFPRPPYLVGCTFSGNASSIPIGTASCKVFGTILSPVLWLTPGLPVVSERLPVSWMVLGTFSSTFCGSFSCSFWGTMLAPTAWDWLVDCPVILRIGGCGIGWDWVEMGMVNWWMSK